MHNNDYSNALDTDTELESPLDQFDESEPPLPDPEEMLPLLESPEPQHRMIAARAFCELQDDGKYCRMAHNYSEKFHIIIVDGRDRVNCCKNSITALTDDGVIVLDDSERPQYKEAIDYLKSKGFKELPFSGISPGSFINKSTTIFYKSKNCLGI